jgi:hypothetical protein
MGKDYAYLLLDEAIELLSESDLRRLFGQYVELETVRADVEEGTAGALLPAVEAFAKASLAGEYYEPFEVTSRSYTQRSAGTLSWIAECRRLFERCARADRSAPAEVASAFDILFGLLDRVDECTDGVVFFADEAGSWQVGVDWDTVLPAWFAVLSATAAPDAFARRVVDRVRQHCAHRAAELLAVAGAAATPAQRAALGLVISGPRNGEGKTT